MDTALTIKIKLVEFPKEFDVLTKRFCDACNYVSNWIFNHDFELNQAKLNKILYYKIRDEFNLKAQLTQSVFRSVVARYKSVRTQISKQPYKFKDINTNKWYSLPRDLTWLKKPLKFSKPQADLQRNRDWSIVNGKLSINTLSNRVHCNYICKGFDKYLNSDWKFGMAKLIKQNNIWYFYVSITKTIPDYDNNQTQHVVGIDRGLRFLATCYNEKGDVKFFSGRQILAKRRKFKRLRSQLQSKNTKSAKRRLKQIGHRENRWMTDVNHQLSKTLVKTYGKNTLFVLEDLMNVTFNTTKNQLKDHRYEHNSWAFYQLEQFLTYKANLNSSKVITIDPAYTSQRCVKCGRINKNNRNHHLHLYICDKCGYQSNDDRIASMNIQFLGTEYISGIVNPSFKN